MHVSHSHYVTFGFINVTVFTDSMIKIVNTIRSSTFRHSLFEAKVVSKVNVYVFTVRLDRELLFWYWLKLTVRLVSNKYLSILGIEALEKGVKYVQSQQ